MSQNDLSSLWRALAEEVQPLHLLEFAINLATCLVLVALLAVLVARGGRRVPPRRELARNLVLVALTTMVIISTVRSSLALSLGLVGALSIVRFRTPVRDPQELALLFVAVALGVGSGAGQRVVTALGLLVIVLALVLTRRLLPPDEPGLVVSVSGPAEAPPGQLRKLLEQRSAAVRLLQFDDQAGGWRADYLVTPSSEPAEQLAEQVRRLDGRLGITISASG